MEPSDSNSPPPSIGAEIASEEARLAQLDVERSASVARLHDLRITLALEEATAGAPDQSGDPDATAALTPREKVRLFRALFRGREDVFPTRFVSRKTGRAGYAPACRNKFVEGVCGLPTIKCGECKNQAFVQVSDAAIVDHLKGRHVMGVYPLLADETCWFLALDFDRTTWREDVVAFLETCRRAELRPAVERSRSGNGAHVWFFFSAPVAAASARTMGCYLITETMSRRHDLSLESYDRLFPSQDTMPRGGFGNLIALPLQHEPRRQGNSVFLDDNLNALRNDAQWTYLASVQRIAPSAVAQIASAATKTGSELDLPAVDSADDDTAQPWTRPPSGKRSPTRISEPVPSVVRAVLSQKLFVEKASLPSAILNQIKRLAAFQNPEFYARQGMRLSTALTPRVISCAEDLPQYIGLPRGCHAQLEALLAQQQSKLQIEDKRVSGASTAHRFCGELTAMQRQVVSELLAHDIGVLVAPPGFGKTVIGTVLVAERACSTLILVNRRPLLDQWIAQLALHLGINPKDIGQLGAGKRKRNGRLDVATIQSLGRSDVVDEIVADYGQVIVDECHHLPALTFERVLSEVKARYIVGLTSTPERRDGHQPITSMQLGPVRFTVGPKNHSAKPPFARRLIVRATGFRSGAGETHTIQSLYSQLLADVSRNELILRDVLSTLDEGRSPMLLTERVDHLRYFASQLEADRVNVIVLRGGMGAKERRRAISQLDASPVEGRRIVLATGRYIGEGFDDSRLDTLFLALPVSWKGTLIQYAGRLHRLYPRKTEVRVYDYVDNDVAMLRRMFEKRLRGYRAIGYATEDVPLDLFNTSGSGRATDSGSLVDPGYLPSIQRR